MKIVSWNCNGALRHKFEYLERFDADIYIVQECENPDTVKHLAYKQWAINYLWLGDNKNRGIGIFANSNHILQKLDWPDTYNEGRVKYFLPCSVNHDFDLLAVWTHYNNSSTFQYIGQFWKYLQVNKSAMARTLIVGDFNSNTIWDKKDRKWNHSAVVEELKALNICSFYHLFRSEEHGKELLPTFFLQRKIEKPYHIDYIFGSMPYTKALTSVIVGDRTYWLKLSDHLPIIAEWHL